MGELVAVIFGFFAGYTISGDGPTIYWGSPLALVIPAAALGILYTASWLAGRRSHADKS